MVWQLVYFRVDVPKACILTLIIRKIQGDVDVFVSKVSSGTAGQSQPTPPSVGKHSTG